MVQDARGGDWPPLSALKTGLSCRCPRCGQGRLYAGYLKVVERCSVCGLDLRAHDAGDGPAVFVIFAAGIIVMVLALSVDAVFHPSALIHLALWIPTVIAISLALLRPFKATMVALQYRNDARQGTPEP